MSDEIKIVINLKGDAATIGISKPNCDPVFRTAVGGLGAVMTRAGELVAEANAVWDSNPRYPRCETPLAPQSPPASQTAARVTAQRSSQRQAQAAPQPAMF